MRKQTKKALECAQEFRYALRKLNKWFEIYLSYPIADKYKKFAIFA